MAHNNNQTAKLYFLPALLAVIAIPQLLYWWLAPVAHAGAVIYGFGTFFTVLSPVCAFLLWYRLGLRRSVGAAILAGVLELGVVAAAGLLLAIDVTVRTAVFALLIAAMCYVVSLLPVAISALNSPELPAAAPLMREYHPEARRPVEESDHFGGTEPRYESRCGDPAATHAPYSDPAGSEFYSRRNRRRALSVERPGSEPDRRTRTENAAPFGAEPRAAYPATHAAYPAAPAQRPAANRPAMPPRRPGV